MEIVIVFNEETYNYQMNQKEQNKMAAHLRSNDFLKAVSSDNEHTIFVDFDSYRILQVELVLEQLKSIKEMLKQQEPFCKDMAEILKKIQH